MIGVYEEYGGAPRCAAYDVVLTGAGISMSAPASLPSGDDLMRNTWRNLLRDGLTDGERACLAAVTEKIYDAPPPIWLEPLVEIILGHVHDWETVVSTYVDVGGQSFNEDHAMLARLDALQVTLNMDTLIEAAGGTAWHLHGRWDEPSSIVTTVRQYSDGLPEQTRQALIEALEGKRVLVLGYSGRDTDVMPTLMRSEPEVVHWMHYGAAPVAASVERLQSRLGKRMTVFSGGAREVLPVLPQTRAAVPFPGGAANIPPDRYGAIPRAERLLAAGAVAFDLGFYTEARQLLEPVRLRGRHEVTRRKLVARAHIRMSDPREGVRVLLSPPKDLETLVAWHRVANELTAVLPSLGHPAVGRVADRIVMLYPRKRVMALVRAAGSDAMRGQLELGERRIAEVCADPLLHQKIGVTGVVDALTTYADLLKLRGSYGRALEVARSAVGQAHYANGSQRAFALRRLAEIAHVAGVPSVQPSEDRAPCPPAELLLEAYQWAVDAHDWGAAYWSAIGLADVAAGASGDEASEWVSAARKCVEQRSPIAEVFLLLVTSSIEKRWGDAGEAVAAASAARDRGRGWRLAVLVAELSTLQCRAAVDPGSIDVGAAVALERQFARFGADNLAARVGLLRMALEGDSSGARAEAYGQRGWRREASVARMSPGESLGYTWPVLL